MNKNALNFSEVIRLLGKPVTYYPSMAHALKDDRCALFLSNFYHWEGKQKDITGWIYKSQAEIFRETGLKRSMQETVRKKLLVLEIMKEKRMGNPGTMHYKFNWSKFNEILHEHYKDQDNTSEQTKASTIYEMSEAFNEVYFEVTEMAYAWSTDRRDAGRDWGPLKRLKDVFIDRIKTKNGNQLQPPQEEVVNNFKMFLKSLPDYHRERNLTPALLLSNFNKIILDIKTKGAATKKSNRKNKAGEYV